MPWTKKHSFKQTQELRLLFNLQKKRMQKLELQEFRVMLAQIQKTLTEQPGNKGGRIKKALEQIELYDTVLFKADSVDPDYKTSLNPIDYGMYDS